MNRNISDIATALKALNTKEEILCFLNELLTEAEQETLSKRWQIMTMLNEGATQREIAQKLNVSLCKVTRGAKILKNKKAIVTKILMKG